jgi:carbamoyl-phosphate synthase large subunit
MCGLAMAKVATRLMMGTSLDEIGLKPIEIPYRGVKESIFPFHMFQEVDPLLGPEMRSTGEVLGLGRDFGTAFYKAQEATATPLPLDGTVLITISEKDRAANSRTEDVAGMYKELGFRILATRGTQVYLAEHGIESDCVLKAHEGRPDIVDAIKNGDIQLLINTPTGKLSLHDDSYIRKNAIRYSVPYITTLAAAAAAAAGIEAMRSQGGQVKSIQNYHSEIV